MRHILSLSVLAAILGLGGLLPMSTQAGDWPQWRYDAARGAVSPDALPDDLSLHWVRQLPQPRPAWPKSQPWLRLDESYSPVAAEGLLFVPSMVHDSLTAYDIESGAMRWRFYADGPIRLAPVFHRQKVYVASDDGFLYCLAASDGRPVWRFRGGPSDRRVLGHERLISTWPIRGGPVVDDGKVYFTAGIWPFMGIFAHAVDAESGESFWTGSGQASTYQTQPHSSPAFAGFVPRGHLAVGEGGLIAPGGRTQPGRYDLASGDLLGFEFGGKDRGACEVSTWRQWFFADGSLCRAADGKTLQATAAEIHDDRAAYHTTAGRITAEAFSVDDAAVETIKVGGKQFEVSKLELKPLWDLPLDEDVGRLFLKAGSRFYAAKEGRVYAIEVDESADAKARIEWKAPFEGDCWTMLAAGDRLFLVTDAGRLYCFGPGEVAKPKLYVPTHAVAADSEEPQPLDKTAPAMAHAIKQADAVAQGYAVVLGLDDAELPDLLARSTELHVIVVDPSVDRVDAFRRKMDVAGLYGRRVVAHVGDPATFRFPPYLANLVCVNTKGRLTEAVVQNAYGVLRPYGGCALFAVAAGDLRALVDGLSLESSHVVPCGDWTAIVREGALPGAADWTHQYADAANSVFSADARVKAPLGLLWFGGPSNDQVLPRHGHGPSPQVAAGRLFIEGAEMLRAIDIYTGRLLWENEIPGLGAYYDNTSHHPGAGEIGANYISLADSVYVVNDASILRLDSQSGETLNQFTLEPTADNPKPSWGFAAAWEDLLVATSTPVSPGDAGKTVGPAEPSLAADSLPLIKSHETWRYLAGNDPVDAWKTAGFDDATWKSGDAGFGYGDDDDRTKLTMRDRYARVYLRKRFSIPSADEVKAMSLMINYDDAFIAYLNGTEIIRQGVKTGSGAAAKDLSGHEAEQFEQFPIDTFRTLLRDGANLLAVEGHNAGVGSSDFSLDPYLTFQPTADSNFSLELDKQNKPRPLDLRQAMTPTRYSSASRRLAVMNRISGATLWQDEARYSFRHNNLALGAGTLFVIDGMSQAKLATLQRRGVPMDNYEPRLFALDIRTGKELWRTTDNVFGTFLSYSAEFDILLQAGAAGRDRAKDESTTGMIAYRGATGKVLWSDLERAFSGPCILRHDTIITQGGGGSGAYSLLTGEIKMRPHPLSGEPLEWKYTRNYGCNTSIASEHLLTFRSAAAGYYDLENDGGTGNLGGFKSGCTSNLIPAGGVLAAPDYTRTCTCRYQNQTSLGLVHDPTVEQWTFNGIAWDKKPVRRVGINLAAPGDRLDDKGLLWLDYPSRGGTSPDLPIEVTAGEPFRRHSSLVGPEADSVTPAWVAASGLRDVRRVLIRLGTETPEKERLYTVRLHFAQPDAPRCDIMLQGRTVESSRAVARQRIETGSPTVKQFENVPVVDGLNIVFVPEDRNSPAPSLCGIEVWAE